MIRGYDRSDFTAKANLVFEEGRKRGVPTLAIGDLGNELGMGLIEDVVHEVVPETRTCQCPCQGGSADATAADVLLVAENSNIGAYAAAALLGAAIGRVDLIHDGESEMELLLASARAGALDGMQSTPEPSVDGTPGKAMAAAVDLLRYTVEVTLDETVQEPFYFGYSAT